MVNKVFAVTVLLVASLFFLTGCSSLKPKLLTSERLSNVSKNKAYIVVGQKIVTSETVDGKNPNITHMAMALHVGGDLLTPMKGINLPQTALPASIFRGCALYEFLVADASGHNYRVWEIPEKMVKAASRSVIFTNMAASKEGFFIPFDKSLLHFNDHGMAPLERGSHAAYDTFKGLAFVIDRPGVYYLGEIGLAGVFETSGWIKIDKERGGILSWRQSVTGNKDGLHKYLAGAGMQDLAVYDLSLAWGELSMNKLSEYKSGGKDVEFVKVK